MMFGRLSFRASVQNWSDSISILMCAEDAEGKICRVATHIEPELVEHKPWSIVERGTLELQAEEAQSLMAALWSAGVRPPKVPASDGEIKRLESHLEDMRKLVFEVKR